MSLAEYSNPVTPRYVNLILLEMFGLGENYRVLRESEELRSREGLEEVPSFAQVRNRLKVMCKLDPVRYQVPKEGTFVVVVSEDQGGAWFDVTRRVKVVFHDAEAEPFIELHIAFVSRELGGDPAFILR